MSFEDQKDSEQIISIRQSIKSLNIQREALEHEIAAIVSELTARNPENPTIPPMGIDTPLTDAEGYPRNDIDVFRARTLRNRLAIIRTDHKNYMRQMETLLQQMALLQKSQETEDATGELEARRKAKPKPKFDPITGKWLVRNWDGTIAGTGTAPDPKRSFDDIGNENLVTNHFVDTPGENESTAYDTQPQSPVVHRAAVVELNGQPLARVESVVADSPASLAGLLPNDWIVAFGPFCNEFQGDAIAQLVQQAASKQEMIELRIRRDNHVDEAKEMLLLQLSPRSWKGRGLLGCHIVPVKG